MWLLLLLMLQFLHRFTYLHFMHLVSIRCCGWCCYCCCCCYCGFFLSIPKIQNSIIYEQTIYVWVFSHQEIYFMIAFIKYFSEHWFNPFFSLFFFLCFNSPPSVLFAFSFENYYLYCRHVRKNYHKNLSIEFSRIFQFEQSNCRTTNLCGDCVFFSTSTIPR